MRKTANLQKILTLLISMAVLVSCQSDAGEMTENLRSMEIQHEVELSFFTGKLFEFSQTTDPGFCDFSKKNEGDCNTGYLYFTPAGNVIYRYVCVSAPVVNYGIGKLIKEEDKFVIFFDKVYNVKIEDIDPTAEELNAGTFSSDEPLTIKMEQAQCEGIFGFEFNFDSAVEYYYVQLDKDQSSENFFLKEFNQINALKKY